MSQDVPWNRPRPPACYPLLLWAQIEPGQTKEVPADLELTAASLHLFSLQTKQIILVVESFLFLVNKHLPGIVEV